MRSLLEEITPQSIVAVITETCHSKVTIWIMVLWNY